MCLDRQLRINKQQHSYSQADTLPHNRSYKGAKSNYLPWCLLSSHSPLSPMTQGTSVCIPPQKSQDFVLCNSLFENQWRHILWISDQVLLRLFWCVEIGREVLKLVADMSASQEMDTCNSCLMVYDNKERIPKVRSNPYFLLIKNVIVQLEPPLKMLFPKLLPFLFILLPNATLCLLGNCAHC